MHRGRQPGRPFGAPFATLRWHGPYPSRSRNPPPHRARRTDAGAAVHGALPHPPGARLLHEPRPVRPRWRLRHVAGGEPDFRRAGRTVGGVSVAGDGRAGERASRRARSRPRHADAGRDARSERGAGVPRRAGRPPDRDQPGAARAPGGDAQRDRRAEAVARQLRRGARRPRDRARQRILRRAAGVPGRQADQRLVRAYGRDRRDEAISPSASPTSRCRCSTSC